MTYVIGSQANSYHFPPQNFAPPAKAVGATVMIASQEGVEKVQERVLSAAARNMQLFVEASKQSQNARAPSNSSDAWLETREEVLTDNEYQQYFVEWVEAQPFYPGELEAITRGGWVEQEKRAIEFALSLESQGYPISKRGKILKNIRALFQDCKNADVLPTSRYIKDVLRGEAAILSAPARAPLQTSPERRFRWRAALAGAVIGLVVFKVHALFKEL